MPSIRLARRTSGACLAALTGAALLAATAASGQLRRDRIEVPAPFAGKAAAAASLAACSQCDIIYAGDCNQSLWAIDTTTGVSTLIGMMPANMFDIGMTPDGRLFGVTGGGTVYEISTCDATSTLLSATLSGNGMGGDLATNTLYVQGPPLQSFDPATLVTTTIGGVFGGSPPLWCGGSSGDLAVDPLTGVLYSTLAGCVGCGGDELVTLDPATGNVLAQVGCIHDALGAPIGGVFGVAFDSAGHLWGGLGFGPPELLDIDTATALATPLPVTGGYSCAYGLASVPCPRVGPSTCAPLTQGFWKRVCEGTHPSGEHEKLPGYVGCVSAVRTFRSVRSVADLCDRLHPNPTNDKCEQAEAQFMALMLNVCSTRLGRDCCIDIPGEPSLHTVADAISAADALLSQATRTFQDCVRAQAICDAINTGAALCTHPILPPNPAPIRLPAPDRQERLPGMPGHDN